MKEIRKYRCEFCHVEYTDKAEAMGCERSHKKPIEIVDVVYRARSVDRSGLPAKITVKMSDGSGIIYSR